MNRGILTHSMLCSFQMLVFLFMLSGSVFLMFNVTVGLDQELAMPQVSHSLVCK